MKYLIVFVLVLITAAAYGARSELEKDGSGQKLQGCSFNGTKDVNLTAASQTVNMSTDNCWNIYAPTACKYRTMPTAVKSGLTRSINAGERLNGIVSSATPFINFTGCTSAELQRQ